ncbi:hypothetical protein GCM10023156_41380 [Novipirellula rosea]|uniref:Uncharacterized protein n=1 Tax=Novipirellula rosea TaxID=1031540 RepID=A0ABP8N5L3_9BACT
MESKFAASKFQFGGTLANVMPLQGWPARAGADGGGVSFFGMATAVGESERFAIDGGILQ